MVKPHPVMGELKRAYFLSLIIGGELDRQMIGWRKQPSLVLTTNMA
jgi:hypothetical protein